MSDDMFAQERDLVMKDIERRGLPPVKPKEPGMWEGLGSNLRGGLATGGVYAARGIGMAVAPIAGAINEKYGPSLNAMLGDDREPLQDMWFRGLDAATKPAVDYWKPDPARSGQAAQIVGGFARIVLPLMAGGGNPAALVAGEQVAAYDDLTAQGVDGDTANKAAAIRGATTAIGTMLPAALVTGKLAAAGAGAGANVAVGMTDRQATKMVLEYADYDEIAKQYDALDGTSMVIDALVGGAFGAIAAKPRAPKPTKAELAAAMVRNDADVADASTLVTAPDPIAKTEAIRAQEVAARQIESGEQVSVAVQPDPVAVEEMRQRALNRVIGERIEPDMAKNLTDEELGSMIALAKEATKGEKNLDLRRNWMTLSDEKMRRIGENQKAQKAMTQPVKVEPKPVEPTQQDAAPLDPIAQMVARNPDMIVRDDMGNDIRAADLLKMADDEIMQAETDKSAYQAAVTCFLSFGGK